MNLHTSSENWTESRGAETRLAIVGIGCRFPGNVDRPEKYLDLLRNQTCAISEATDGRWNSDHFFSSEPDVPQRSVTKWAGFVHDITKFDADHFGISPREAEAMDPQQRLLLRVTWEAFEDAGIAPDRLAGSNTGVYVGISMSDYKALQNTVSPDVDLSHMATGVAMSVASNRISHKMNFNGPSISVDTACSSSLVATDLACQALRSGECNLAVVGGVNLLLDPAAFVSFSKARMVSPTGRVLTFDARADGFVRAEGAGIVLLKRLEDAEAAGDKIYAVLLGSGVNSDGHTSTLTVPNPEAQATLFRNVCQRAGVAPEDVGYVEAHGTGTPVGDPIEAHAIGEVFGQARPSDNPVLIGSIKSNIGHLEAGAGVAGLIKAALSLKHEQTFANPNFEQISPTIPADRLNIEVSTNTRPWPAGDEPRRAVVNSFGFGGTNACVLLEEAPAQAKSSVAQQSRRTWIAPISAATNTALASIADDVAERLEAGASLRDTVATLAMDRAALPERMAILASSRSELIERLRAVAEANDAAFREGANPSIIAGRSSDQPTTAFAFSGQGSQWHGMARRLIEKDAVFADAMREADIAIRKRSGWSVFEELARPRSETRIDETTITQACIFAVQVGLYARWRDWGIRPDMMFGHSLGEIAAAHASGALSLEDAVTVLHYRSSLQAETEGKGAIYAVGMSAEAMQEHLLAAGEENIEIAAINSDQMVTIAGEKDALAGFLKHLRSIVGSDLFRTRIRMNFAPHSPQMDPLRDRFLEGLAHLKPQPTEHPLISTVTGDLIDGSTMDAEYWWHNIRRPVLFQNAMQTSIEQGATLYLEIGPDAPLSGLIATSASELGEQPSVVISQKRGRNDERALQAALARLFVAGVRPDWSRVYPGSHTRLDLARYPEETKEYWLDGGKAKELMNRPAAHPLLGHRTDAPEPTWEKSLSLSEHTYLRDHKVNGSCIFPAAGYLEMMFAVYQEIFGDGPIELADVEFTKANFLDPEKSELFQTRYDPGRRRIAIYSRPADMEEEWDLRAYGSVLTASGKFEHMPPPDMSNPDRVLEGKTFYKKAIDLGYTYEGGFRGIKKTATTGDLTWANLAFRRHEARAPGYIIHPSITDCMLQIGIAELFELETEQKSAKAFDYIYLPRSLQRLRLERPLPGRFDVLVKKHATNNSRAELDKKAYNTKGELLLQIDHYTAAAVHRSDVQEEEGAVTRYYTDDVVPAQLSPVREADKSGLWLIFGDQGGIGSRLVRKLRQLGYTCLTVSNGQPFNGFKRQRCSIDPQKPGEFSALMKAVGEMDEPLSASVFLWPCDHAHVSDGLNEETLKDVARRGVFPALDLVQALIEHRLASALYIATKGARVTADDADRDDYTSIALSPLLGLARTVHSECPAIRIAALDLDADETSAATHARQVVAEVTAVEQVRETEIAYRKGQRLVPRFAARGRTSLSPRMVAGQSARGENPFALEIDQPGDLEDLHIVETKAHEPKEGEVTVGVRAVGLNFRDVMAATGLLPIDAEIDPAFQKLGMECAGIVKAVGPEVEDLQTGDRVIATSRGCFRSDLTVDANIVRKTPDGMGPIEAATLLTAFSTAYYGLLTQARLAAGERVLIHLGTGGVGLAAIQIAQMVGAEVYTTAGSPRKRKYLRDLGIEHVMDSRSIDFIDDIDRITEGKGVHVVLNALSGEALQRGLDVLAPGGRFVEIGKRDIYADTALGLKVMRRNISLFAVDMARLSDDNPDVLKEVLTNVADLVQAGTLKALPAETFSLNQASDAFMRMAKGEHIGKIVVTVDPEEVQVALSDDSELQLDPDGSYLVTGGLGGFGLEVAVRMAERGAGTIYLMSRSGASTKQAKAGVRRIRKAGAKPVVVKGDVSEAASVAKVMARIDAGDAPLRGIIHAAVAYDDALLPQLDHQRMQTVFAPKVEGSWNLHTATADRDLDFLAFFSSTSVPLGNVGQANYVAANMFMENLARYRRAIGLPGLCIAWGVMATGEVERNPELKKLFESSGVPPMPVETALAGLEIMLRKSDPSLGYAAIDWQKYATANSHVFAQPRMVGHAVTSRSTGDRQAYHETMAAPRAARPAIIGRYLTEAIAKVLKIEPERIDQDTSLQDIGLDSLTAFQLKNRAEAEYGLNLQVSSFLQKPSVRKLTEVVAQGLERGEVAELVAGGGIDSSIAQISQRQSDILTTARQHKDNPSYLRSFENAGATHISPPMDLSLLREAVTRLAEENPVIASRFPMKRGRHAIAQCRADKLVEVEDCRHMDDATFDTHLQQTVLTPMDLSRGPLFKITVFHRSDVSDVVLVRSHNAVLDGLSFMLATEFAGGIFLRASSARIEAMRDSLSYADFAEWQRKFVSSPKGRTQLLYWQKKLRDAGPALALPYDRARVSSVPEASASHSFLLPGNVKDHLKQLAAAEGRSMFAIMLTVFAKLLRPFSNDRDIFITTTASARTRTELEGTIGAVSNTIIVRAGSSPLVADLQTLDAIETDLTESLANQDYPAGALRRDLNLKSAPDTILDQVSFSQFLPESAGQQGSLGVLANVPGARVERGQGWAESVDLPSRGVRRDLAVLVQDHEGDVTLRFEYDAGLFEAETIEALAARYIDIAAEFAPDSSTAEAQVG